VWGEECVRKLFFRESSYEMDRTPESAIIISGTDIVRDAIWDMGNGTVQNSQYNLQAKYTFLSL